VSAGLEEMLIEDNRRMRAAGTALAEAALRVVREYDGVHRLALAVAAWSTAVANEGGRGKDPV
jgi:molybdenum-dependent DNA-binding transcriptional regulator ModE